MIKIKDIIKEHKIIVTESFKAGKLRALVGNQWSGLDSTFWSYGAKLGVQWDKITDEEIETNAKPKKKGIARNLIGGTIFGLGWALGGSCPGPMYILLGAGVWSMLIVIAAAILGTFIYGILKDKLPH